MPFIIALAVREMGITPMEALRAATFGGAAALRRSDVGHLGVGATSRLTVLDAPSYQHLAYRPGVPIARPLDDYDSRGRIRADRSSYPALPP